jgi:uncharacterized protein YuzB (UPF0349 family)
MCLLRWGYFQGALVVNCFSKGCLTGCGMNATNRQGSTSGQINDKETALELIISGAYVNISEE